MLGKSACYLICNNNLDETYLFYLLQSNYLKVVFGRELTATTISNLSLGTIRNSLILVPDLKEQQKIASILSSIDEKISDLESKKKAAESLKKGLMQKLLTGEIRVKT